VNYFKGKKYCSINKSGLSRICIFKLFLSGLFFLNPSVSLTQEYGLGFFGAEAVKDKRTKLDLNHEGYYSFREEFELSFMMKLRPAERTHFGYVARIIDKDNRNIDIIYNGPESSSLQIIYGQELTNISLPDNYPDIYDNWIELRLKIDLKNRYIQFSTPDTALVDPEIDLNGKVKILFGANDFIPVKTNDVPAMSIKDIRICVKNKCKHHFPLNESEGNFANDLISKKKAFVQNPLWIKPLYLDWSKTYHTPLKGFAAVTYDYRDEKVYMIGSEEMKIYSVVDEKDTTHTYELEFNELQPGSQAFFDTILNTLICYNLKIRTVHSFNESLRIWEQVSQGSRTSTPLWFHNKYYSNPDSTLYIFGGYGQHKYSKAVQRYDLVSQLWDTLPTTGDIFLPRMHAALGNYGDTLYLLGGFGSAAGDQILKPHHYTDLMAFSLKENRFIKKYEFRAPMEDIDFAHSMVMDRDEKSYYVLASTIFEYESYLQLLKGNLGNPDLIMLGNRIPYIFHNENSYSDLYYSKTGQKLIAATFLANLQKDTTDINVYTIKFPPHISEIEKTVARSSPWRLILPILLVLFTVLTGLIVWYFRKKGIPAATQSTRIKIKEPQEDPDSEPAGQRENGKDMANSILFFGGFQIISRDGIDITSKFTPLLKELFLLIFLNSIKDKGISIVRLTELLWFPMDYKSAKNNRAVNIAKLKNLLAEIDGLNINRKTGYWQIEFDDSVVYNDYWTCLKIIDQQKLLSREELKQFLSMIKKGTMLGNASYEWLDEFKSEFSNLIIDTVMKYTDQINTETEPELIIAMADAILLCDILHEEAISLKCKALTVLGKHNLAKNAFTKFTREYRQLYDEEYDKSFSDIIKS
jgi:two-component SAPR family response regulator